jgi:cell division protein FtsL
VHTDLNSQLSYEAQSRAALQNQVNDLSNALRENLEEQVLKYANLEEVAKMRSDSR